MGRSRRGLVAVILAIMVLFTSCGGVKRIEKKTKENQTNIDGLQVSEMVFEVKSISEIRADAEAEIDKLGTKKSKYENIGKSNIIPIITEKDEIYQLQLKRLDGNEISGGKSFSDLLESKKSSEGFTFNEIYRNDKEKIKTKLRIKDGTDVKDLIEYVEEYMNTTYEDSPFQWCVDYMEILTSKDNEDFIGISIRPSFDGVVFMRTLVLNDGKPPMIASDFRSGTLNVNEMNNIYEYSGISPYYEVERQGEPIGEILSIDSILSIVANKIDKNSISDIKSFELAYRLDRSLSAVPIWNIVINEKGNDRNFQIDAVTGDVYFE